ncbi:MAG: BamA/TamA family outer membrane protein, partial [Propionivibrio sp.]
HFGWSELTTMTGPRYRYGEIRIEGLQRYSPELVERYTKPLRSGEVYRQDELLAVQTALQNSPYFASVRVDLGTEENAGESADQQASGNVDTNAKPATTAAEPLQVATAPVIIRLREKQPYEVTLGAGVSSNTGARVEANFRDIDFLHRAWDLRTGARIEQKAQSAYADVFFPLGEGQRQDSVGAVIEKSDIEGLGIERIAFAASRMQPRGSIEQRVGLSYQYERQSPKSAPTTINRALTPTIGWLWRYSKHPLDVSEGIAAQLQLGVAAKSVLSDQNFLRTYFRYTQGISLSRSNSLLLRGEIGVTAAPSRDGIPQNNLFRAGGSNSVRGYRYQSLGVKEDSATLGGRYLLTLSAEYTHWLDEQWGIAAFVDAGQAADNTNDVTQLATGVGVGARWKSPAGALAIDLAYGANKKYDGGVRLHFSLAVPF